MPFWASLYRSPFRDASFLCFDQTNVPCRTCWTSWPRRAAQYSMSPMFLNPVQAPWAMKEVGACWCLKTRKLHICCRSDSDDEQALYNFWHSVLCFGEMWIFEKVRYTYFSAVPPWPVLFSDTSYRLHANSTLQMVEQISFEIKSDMLPRDSVLVPFAPQPQIDFFVTLLKELQKAILSGGPCAMPYVIRSVAHVQYWSNPTRTGDGRLQKLYI